MCNFDVSSPSLLCAHTMPSCRVQACFFSEDGTTFYQYLVPCTVPPKRGAVSSRASVQKRNVLDQRRTPEGVLLTPRR